MRKAFLLLLAGFAASTPPPASAQAAEKVPCSVPVASASQEPWQQITARGFTFCIPSSWRAGSRNTFRGDGGWVRWGTGEYRGGPRETGTAIIAVPANEVPNLVPMPRGRYNHFPETIGGSVAELWDSEVDGKFYTGAQWERPTRIYLAGESTDARVRSIQLEIYRTVRFTEP
jgi:hypothetical protein